MNCNAYENGMEGRNWKINFENNANKQFEIANISHKKKNAETTSNIKR